MRHAVAALIPPLLIGGLLAAGPASAEDVQPAPTDSAAPADAAPPAELPMPAALGSWCTTLFPPMSKKTEKRKAFELLRGTVNMGKWGTYQLGATPDWKPQSGTDTAGDRHINSLDWALPLLYRGVRVQNKDMVNRFRQILTQWIEDHRGKRDYWVNATIYGGLRTQTLVCAAQTLNDPVITAAALEDAQRMVSTFWGSRTVGIGANNTDLIRQTGALAAYCWTGDTAQRDKAWANLVAVARGVIQDDGSDVEGSPGYAMYIEKLLRDVEASAATCGIPNEPIPQLRGLLYAFVAQAARPDFKMSSIGDSIVESMRDKFGIGDWRADWIRSGGATGKPPTPVYTAFKGGYVFGRAGWQPQPGGPDTYYSLRFSSSRPATAHAHDDGAALTLYSRGVEWIGDPGPYKYENGSALRGFMKTRTAHSSFTVSNVSRTMSRGVQRINSRSDWQEGGNDYTCLRDDTWGTVTVTRCVTYVRSADVVIVADHITAAKVKVPKPRRASFPDRVVKQRWQVSPNIGAEQPDGNLTLVSGDARLEIVRGGEGGWEVTTAKEGSSVGWFTGAWGQKVPGAVLGREAKFGRLGGEETLVTVFVPRTSGESVPVTIDANGVTILRNGRPVTVPIPNVL